MSTFVIIIIPADRRSGRFDCFHATNGRLICRSRQPLLDAARILLARGHSPADTIAMRHAGAAFDAMTASLGEAAKWTVKEGEKAGPRFAHWEPFSRAPVSAPMRLNGPPVPDATPGAERAHGEVRA